MPNEYVSPRKVQEVVKDGFERLTHYRKARTMFMKAFIGQYYSSEFGLTGNQPINLIFTTIRALVPNIVMQNPVNQAVTKILEHKTYAELLSLGLNSLHEDLNLKKLLRGWIVDAIFGLGIVDSGLESGDRMISYDDVNIDPGQIFSELVSIDDFTFDPTCTEFENAAFMGRRLRVPRQILLDDDRCDHDLVMKLPSASSNMPASDKVSSLTQKQMNTQNMQELQDFVDVVKLWIPRADASIIVPDPYQVTFDKYIKITDYYGPHDGPYSFLSLSPPVSDNPLPIAPVSIWYDLHNMANEIFEKAMEQAKAQKNITFYNPAQADEMQEALESDDNGTVASIDPSGFRTVTLGGQNPENEFMIRNLQGWYNYIAGNPAQMEGAQSPGNKQSRQTATLTQVLQSNAGIVIEDYRDIIYDGTAHISKKHAWYLHTDPLIDLPLIQRKQGQEDVQVSLTPEQRKGDFLQFTFKIVARSMSRLDPQTRSKRIMEFCSNILPAAAASAQQMTQLAVPFNLQKYLTKIADELEIGEWVQDLFDDPEFEQKMALLTVLGPQNAGKGQILTPEAISQNGGYPEQRNILSPGQEFNQNAQVTAGEAQSQNIGAY